MLALTATRDRGLIKHESVWWASVMSVIILGVLLVLNLLIVVKSEVHTQKLLRIEQPFLPPLLPDARRAGVLLPGEEGADSSLDSLIMCEDCFTQTPFLHIDHLRGDIPVPERQGSDTNRNR